MIPPHPFVNSLTDKSVEELLETINRLNKQASHAARSGNQQMLNQINMALTSYRSEYDKRQADLWNKNKKSGDLDNKIDIG